MSREYHQFRPSELTGDVTDMLRFGVKARGGRVSAPIAQGAAEDIVRFLEGLGAEVLILAEIPSPSEADWEWASRVHLDPYCADHCSPGVKHSQCGCPCDHRLA